MPVETASDLAEFFEEEEFAVPMTLADNNTVTVSVIFDYVPILLDDGYSSVSTNTPMATCQTADVTGVVDQGDNVIIDSVEYSVKDIRDDGTGVTELGLFKV